MMYKDYSSIKDFLNEMDLKYNRLLDCVIFYVDGDVLLENIGGCGFRLDNRIKTKSATVIKSRSVYNICSQYRVEYISQEEAIQKIQAVIKDLKEGGENNGEDKKNGFK